MFEIRNCWIWPKKRMEILFRQSNTPNCFLSKKICYFISIKIMVVLFSACFFYSFLGRFPICFAISKGKKNIPSVTISVIGSFFFLLQNRHNKIHPINWFNYIVCVQIRVKRGFESGLILFYALKIDYNHRKTITTN